MKSEKDNEHTDLLSEYLSEDPSILTSAQKSEIARVFDMSRTQVELLIKRMSRAREEVRKEYGEEG